MPVLAGTATLLLLIVGGMVLLPYLSRQERSPFGTMGSERPARELREQIQAGRKALAEGAFHQATLELGQARELVREQPQLLSGAELRELDQCRRQADLLDRLLRESLQELLDQAQMGPDDEWQARFHKEYQGKTVIFDDTLKLDGEGRPALLATRVCCGEIEARIALEELDLPMPQHERVIFGARLAGLAREQGGRWVIRLERDSGVLLTDRDAFRACARPCWNEIPRSRPSWIGNRNCWNRPEPARDEGCNAQPSGYNRA